MKPMSSGGTRGNRFLASIYDTVMVPVEAMGIRDQRRRIGAAARGRVLELGAGTGAMLEHYGDHVEEVVATDPDPHMLARAHRRRHAAKVPVEIREADAQDLLFGDDSFDTVVLALSLCTIPEPDAALAEARRVLRPNGQLLFVEHVRSARPWLARIQSFLAPAWEKVAGGCQLDRDTVASIEQAGFQVERLWRSGEGKGIVVQGRATPAAG